MEDERTTRIMILDTDTNTKYTDQICLEMLYQAEITDYIKRSIDFNKNLRKSCTFIWEFCNKQLQ